MATTSIGAPGVTFPDATVQASAGATGVPVLTRYISPSSYTKPALLKAIKVTVVGGGGAGAVSVAGASGGGGGGISTKNYPASSLPASAIPFTAGAAVTSSGATGNSSSFGVAPLTVITATGGGGGTSTLPGPVTMLANGGDGGVGSSGDVNGTGGKGGSGGRLWNGSPTVVTYGNIWGGYGSGNAGYGNGGSGLPSGTSTGTSGAVIIEEFY